MESAKRLKFPRALAIASIAVSISFISTLFVTGVAFADVSSKDRCNERSTSQREFGCSYYLAEGSTRKGFEEYICILNSWEETVATSIVYMLEAGDNIEENVELPPHSRTTINVNDAIGKGEDVSTTIYSQKPIVVERPMYFYHHTGGNIVFSGGHNAMAAESLSKTYYFAEGYTELFLERFFDTYLCFLNPNTVKAEVGIKYLFKDSEPLVQEIEIEPERRMTVSVNDYVGYGKEVSMIVESDQPILVERPMYFFYNDWVPGGTNVIGATELSANFYFAEGCTREMSVTDAFNTFLCLGNPTDSDATVNVTYYYQEDIPPKTVPHELPAQSRRTVNVNRSTEADDDKNVSMKVESTTPIIAERPMYFYLNGTYRGGHNIMGINDPKNEFCFAEGCTRHGFQEWLSLFNPSGTVSNVKITYTLGTGEVMEQEVAVQPVTRSTVNVNQFVGAGQDVSCKVESDRPIVAERPMYFLHGFDTGMTWSGGTVVMGKTQ